LRELGWVEGRNVAIEYRWADGRTERLSTIAAEFVRLKLDLIVSSGGGAYALKQATSDIPIVVAAAQHFHSEVVDVVSAFRHPKFNLILRKKGHQVARDSQHTHGNAIDFFVPNVTTPQLHAWAKAQKLGGVGIYLQSGFVHMDTGPIRFWSGD
jgi:hypothetical protein